MALSPIRMACASLGAAGALSCSILFPIGDEYAASPNAVADANTESATDARTDAAVADGAPAQGVYCFGQSCDTNASFCCLNQCTGAQGSCQPRDQVSTCTGCDVPLLCDDALDCEGMGADAVCCVLLASATTASRAECQHLLDCQRTRHLIVCDPRVPEPCPNGAECQRIEVASKFVSGWICKDQ